MRLCCVCPVVAGRVLFLILGFCIFFYEFLVSSCTVGSVALLLGCPGFCVVVRVFVVFVVFDLLSFNLLFLFKGVTPDPPLNDNRLPAETSSFCNWRFLGTGAFVGFGFACRGVV